MSADPSATIKCPECGKPVVWLGWGEDEYGPYQATACLVCHPEALDKFRKEEIQ